MLVKVYGSALYGIEAQLITIEVNIGQGAFFTIVGLPDNAIKESGYRIRAAFKNNGYGFPRKGITINMAPADLRKEGAAYDLSIAVGILAASGEVLGDKLSQYLIMGELSLDGALHPIKGALPIAIGAKGRFKGIILPKANAVEVSILENIEIIGCEHITQVLDFLNNHKTAGDFKLEKSDDVPVSAFNFLDFSDVKGQHNIKRAMTIAASGGHNVLLVGPPGAGKSMLAKRLPSILPPMTIEETLETTKVHSVAGLAKSYGLVRERPFRSPHHTISDVALVGGGTFPSPGEISLAHNGVLFLDELTEFKRNVLEVLRQPLEDRVITISRARSTFNFPASFMLIASMNPCPCGFYNHPTRECTCSDQMISRYMSKISGPLLDRIDMHVEVTPVPLEDLSSEKKENNSAHYQGVVNKARGMQKNRFNHLPFIHYNSQMNTKEVVAYCGIDQSGKLLLNAAIKKLGLSARAYDRILKVARTIADIEGCTEVRSAHLAEAIGFRSFDRTLQQMKKV